MKFASKKNLGQNFLIDKAIINLIVEAGNIKNQDEILEVGPGTGALTEQILKKKPNEFTIIEKDKRLADSLKKKFGKRLKIINEDMLKISYEKYSDQNLILFGNLPYNISTQILVKWIKTYSLKKFCKKFILMFQKEVADRILAQPNTTNYGRLSILSNWRMKIEKISDVEPESFYPRPKVRSTILTLTPKEHFYNLKNVKNLEHVTNIFFNQRRKMIKKPMKFLFDNFDHISKELSLDLNSRPQNLENLTYYKICEIYEELIN